MLGYYNNPEATAAAIDADGWLHTGDLAVRLPNGYYRITGRIKDMVIRGGENIYPREIEEFLFTHPAVEQASRRRRARSEVRRGAVRLDQAQAGMAWNCFGDNGVKQSTSAPSTTDRTVTDEEIRDFCRGSGPLQSAALRPLRRCLPADRDRQDPEVQDPRADERRVGPEGTADGLTPQIFATFGTGRHPLAAL